MSNSLFMSVKERLKYFINSQEMTVRAFEESISASNGYVNSISQGIGLDKIKSIIEKYSMLNIEWLLTGIGNMLKSEESSMVVEEQKSDYIIELQQFKIERLEQELTQLKKELQSKSDREKASKAKH